MKFSLADPGSIYVIRAYHDDRIVIDEASYSESLIILPDQLLPQWPVNHVDQITESHFKQLLETKPDLVLLGTGTSQRFPDPSLYRPLISAGIGLEVMTTAAACRTYNILAGEGRRVSAALILED